MAQKEKAAGADIFICPIDTRYVLVHNISPAKIDEFKEFGFPPSATVETAPNEFQAWVRLTDSPIEKDLSEWIAVELANYGATPEGHYPSNLGRLAGFTNHETPTKPGNPAPYILIHEHQLQTAPNGQKAVDFQRKQMAKALTPKRTATSQQWSYNPWQQPPQGPIVQTPGIFAPGLDPKVLSALGPKLPKPPPQEEEKKKRRDGPSPSPEMSM